MEGQLNVSTPAEYIAALEGPRQADIAALDALIRRTAPKLEPHIRIGIIGYGRVGDWPRISLASNKNYISLYVGEVAGRYKEALPKASIGKSCVRFKRLSDLDPKALAKMIRDAAK